MRLNEKILERVEEFFKLIAVGEEETELVSQMNSLRRFLEFDIDGVTRWSSEELAVGTIHRLHEIWENIDESQGDSELCRHFSDFIFALERLRRRDEIGEEDGWLPEENEIET